MSKAWLFMQLSDSAFPTGGFAHSGGFEAALQAGEIQGSAGLEVFLKEGLWQTGHGVLPLASEAFEGTKSLAQLDEFCDAFLSSSVANRASRIQGRTFLATCMRSLANEKLVLLNGVTKLENFHQHFAPIFGASMKALGLSLSDMQELLLYMVLRSILSAAIRLGVVGPYQAQQIQLGFAQNLDAVLQECAELRSKDLAQTAPLLEIFQSLHDRLYSKLFQS